MPEINVEMEVFCAFCGVGLCNVSEAGNSPRRGQPFIRVQPCSRCMDDKYNEGYKNGYDNGYENGYQKGHDEGYSDKSKEL